MLNEGGNEGWERFRKRQGKTLKKILNKMRKQEKNKALQFKTFGNKKVAKDAVRARESFGEGIGAAYMPQAGKKGVPEREITSKAVKKQLNRNRNRSVMKGDLETPHVRYVHSRDKSTDYIRPEKKKRKFKKKVKESVQPTGKATKPYSSHGISKDATKAELKAIRSNPNSSKGKKQLAHWKLNMHKEDYPADAVSDMKKLHDKEKNTWWKTQDKAKVAADKKKKEMQKENIIAFPMARRAAQLTDKQKAKANADYKQKARDDIKKKLQQRESFGDKGMSLQELGDPDKMNQLFRMGLAKKGELQLMQRMMKRGPDALKDPKLRQKMYDLLVDLTDLVTKDGQTFVKVRQNVQRNKKELQAVKELLHYGGHTILEVNTAYKLINIPEDMSGMSVGSGHKRSVDQGAGMTKKGVAAYRRRNPGSKLKTAVTTPPSKLKKGSKAAKRRKAFCSRSKSWTGERGKAARKRWNC